MVLIEAHRSEVSRESIEDCPSITNKKCIGGSCKMFEIPICEFFVFDADKMWIRTQVQACFIS